MTEEKQNDFSETADSNAPKTHSFTDEQLGSLLAKARREGAERAARRSERAQNQFLDEQAPASPYVASNPNVDELVQQKVLQVLNEIGEHSKKEEAEREKQLQEERIRKNKETALANGRFYESKLRERANSDPEFKKLVDMENPRGVAANPAVFQLAMERPVEQMTDLVKELSKNPDLLEEVETLQETRFSPSASDAQRDRAKRLLDKKINNHFKSQEKPSFKNAPLEQINITPASEPKTPSSVAGFLDYFKNQANSRKG